MFTIVDEQDSGFTITFEREHEDSKWFVRVTYSVDQHWIDISAAMFVDDAQVVSIHETYEMGINLDAITYQQSDFIYDIAIEIMQQFVNDDPSRQWILRAI